MLESIKTMIGELCEAKKLDQDKARFTRRNVRERTQQSETQVRLHLQRLEDLEYIQKRHGRNGIVSVYELMVDSSEPEGIAHVGLLELDQLKKA